MEEHKEWAEYYRIGLLTGLLSVSDVVAWADAEIAGAEKPQYIFIELSLMSGAMPHDICSKLREFPGEVDKFRMIRRVLAGMHSSLRVNPLYGYSFARGLHQLWADCNFEVPKELEPISYLDELFYSPVGGHRAYGLLTLLEFLELFSHNADDAD